MGLPKIPFFLFVAQQLLEQSQIFFAKGKPVETLERKAAGLNPGTIGIRGQGCQVQIRSSLWGCILQGPANIKEVFLCSRIGFFPIAFPGAGR